MYKALILSVGGTPQALIRCLRHYKPEIVCFYASQECIDLVPQVKQGLDYQPRDYKVLIPNINDLTTCYQRSLECSAFLDREGMPPQDTIVDITGGTKVMSAALALLSITRGYSLSYIGGSQRNKEGLGQVVTGFEEVFEQANPWEVLAIEERKKAALLFDRFQFEAALVSINSALNTRCQPYLKHYLSAFKIITESYLNWDRFKHKEATHLLEKGLHELRTYAEVAQDPLTESLAKEVGRNLEFLKLLKEDSGQFKSPCRYYLLDLLANAQRRATEGKYDDAVARLYRSLELLAQLRLRQSHDIDTGNVAPQAVPDPIREDYVPKYLDPEKGKLRLPLTASFELLVALADELGKRYSEDKVNLRTLLDSRNSSILAHGFVPVAESTYNELFKLVLNFGGIRDSELPCFPQWTLPSP